MPRVWKSLLAALLPALVGLYSVAAVAQSEVSDAAPLTAAERTWLSLHPVIRLTPDPHFPPLEYFDEQGVFRGIGADFVTLLEQKLGLRFEIVQVKDWQQSVARTKARENDVWSVVAETPERSVYMLFTAPYIESPAVIIVRSDVERSLSLTDLKGLKVAVSSGYAVHEFLRTKLPGMTFDAVPDPLAGLKKVSFGMADVMVVNLALASHLIEKAGIGNLRLAGEVGYTYRWGLASRRDWPELNAILSKGLAQITTEERQAIRRKWVALKAQPWTPSGSQIIWAVVLLATLFVAGVLAWNRVLKRRVAERTRELDIELGQRQQAEAAHRESERRIKSIVDNIVDGVITIDARGIVQSVNPAVEAMFGRAAEDLVGGNVNRLMPEPHAAAHDGYLARYEAGGEARVIGIGREVEGLHRDGQIFPLYLAVNELEVDGDRLFVGIVRDITERRRVEKALAQRSELIQFLQERARAANRATNLAQALGDTIAGVCAYQGWPVGHAYLVSPDDDDLLLPSGIWHLDDAERFAGFREITEKTTFSRGVGLPGSVLESGKPAWIVDAEDGYLPRASLADDIGLEAGFACPVLAGSKVVAVLEFFTLEAVEPDQMLLTGLQQVGTQLGRVYEREWSEKILRKSAVELHDVLTNVIQGVVMFDNTRKLVVWNDQFREILGFPERFLFVGQPNWNLAYYLAEQGSFGEGDPVRLTTERLNLLWSGEIQRSEIVVNETIYDVLSCPTPGAGLVVTYTNITEAKEAQARIEAQRDALESLNQQKTKLFSIIAHDLKSPFTSLLGLSEMMTKMGDQLSPDQFMDYAETINESGQRLFGLLENLLEWARSQMDQITFEPTPQNVEVLVQQNIELLHEVAQEKGVELASEVPPLTVQVDQHMAEAVLRNLLSNAIKFTAESGSVTVSARGNGAWVEVAVSDDGVGMAADQVENLFRLDRLQSTRGTGGEAGTGLGLLLCKDFVERYGGTIAVDSAPGQGSTFRVRLPAAGQEIAPS
jgi:PAS domain S-box-containing protein